VLISPSRWFCRCRDMVTDVAHRLQCAWRLQAHFTAELPSQAVANNPGLLEGDSHMMVIVSPRRLQIGP